MCFYFDFYFPEEELLLKRWLISQHPFAFLTFTFLTNRRQTAEEREAERQAANRLMLSIQAEAMTKTLYPVTSVASSQRSSSSMQHDTSQSTTGQTTLHNRSDLRMNSPTATSLNALQSLQPWAESTSSDSGGNRAATSPGYHHHHHWEELWH